MKKKAHIIALFGAMINRQPVFIKGDKHCKLIQRINLDGECDLYSIDFKEVTHHDINPLKLTIKTK